eukprot:gb/GECH01012941.1/.p1 GENE.gb/GECH01012941.1/~~gb/GECH01012941.1/.p1  ORF type:complete len:779 (+),score=154.92 gb/GECH01012941.1/:1-2337(+)
MSTTENSPSSSIDLKNMSPTKLQHGKRKRIIMAVRKLPFDISYNDNTNEWEIEESYGDAVISAGKFLTAQGYEVVFTGIYITDASSNQRDKLDEVLWKEHRAVRVGLDLDTFNHYYGGFCKGILWPLFHYMRNRNFDESLWDAYKQANAAFAPAIQSLFRSVDTDYIWIHDYHLLKLPSLLRSQLGESTHIGFFLHSPFPSSEAYRCLPVREELLRDLATADFIGFQTYNFARHFINTCGRLLTVDAEPHGVVVNNRHVDIGIMPTGIDLDRVHQVASSPEVVTQADILRQQYGDKHILVARTKMDGIQGIPQLLRGFEEFLSNHEEWNRHVVLVMLAEPAVEEVEQNAQLLSQVNEMVGAINGKYGKVDFMPIIFSTRQIQVEELYALYRIADSILVTPIRDGMNLNPHEFVVCQQANSDIDSSLNFNEAEARPGAIILSELAGAAQSLSGCTLINPYDIGSISDGINYVLEMSNEARCMNHKFNYQYVSSHTIQGWAKTFITDLSKSNALPRPSPTSYLNTSKIKEAYKRSSKRVLLLDYDGTLVPLAATPEQAAPTANVLKILEDLTQNPKNAVYVVSGRDKNTFEDWLAHLKVGLSCEHGLFLRKHGAKEWDNVLPELDLSWQDVVEEILNDYTERTPGSFVEKKMVNLTWHYRAAHPEYGAMQARSLCDHLKQISAKLPFEVLSGKKAIELRPRGIDKGTVVKRLVSQISDPDFVMCIGDDKTDEDMFNALAEYNIDDDKLFTVRVHNKPSNARYYVNTQNQAIGLLEELAHI